ncbi:hypothetical protein GSI_05677 [Ganoderma sinense ZZ0214-1]|uniref:T6SS Phospholipase effector Tle1-like catalytic domain-containing protein n=1 Tax=Ganoderma sinense ZZ0214-1 TaxID=1077348 RepID=A0A2G8SB46_9APHY|nr:hypothetical protein GSI_05677 [Ganoderma sinense ZZ0214-1]
MAPKTLLVFCDETGIMMDGALDPPDSPQVISNPGDLAPAQGSISSTQYPTNVLHLARSVKSVDAKGNKQVVFYQSGIGAEASLQGDPVTGTTLLQALGTAVASKIRDAYVFIAQNYEIGDEICLFGGAYTARKLSELIDSIGLLTHKNLGLFFGIWRQLMNREAPTIPSDTRRVEIKCIGVWDTVGSVYKEIDALNITDTNVPATVKVALHALSMQENRKKFLPTLWTTPSGGLKPGQILKQVWFAGAHSDVGGGYERHELADISLFWMAGEVESLINLDLDLLRLYSQTCPDPWGTSQPHNAYKETSVAQRHTVGHETRLRSGLITPQSVFHPSLMYSPASTQLQSPDYMVTMNIITESFGPVSYPTLNVFERHCKDRWGRSAPPGGIDDPWIVIRPQWIYVADGSIPSSAVVGGRDAHGNLLYVARAPYYRGGIHPGKASPHSGNAFVSFGGKEIKVPFTSNVVEVLVGPQASVRWAPISGRFSLGQLNGAVPVPGGKEADKRVLYVVRASLHNGIHCGKVELGGHAHIPWGGREEFATEYEVLVYA